MEMIKQILGNGKIIYFTKEELKTINHLIIHLSRHRLDSGEIQKELKKEFNLNISKRYIQNILVLYYSQNN